MIVYYCGMGGHPAISYASDFLFDCPEMKSNPPNVEFEFYAHVPSLAPPRKSNEEMHQKWQGHYQSLPSAWFNKRKSLVEISYRSNLGYHETLIGKSRKAPTCEMFKKACLEIVEHLEFASLHLPELEVVDWKFLIENASRRLSLLPAKLEELHPILAVLRERAQNNLLP